MNFKINYCKLIIQINLKPKRAIISDNLSAFVPLIDGSCKFDAILYSLFKAKKR